MNLQVLLWLVLSCILWLRWFFIIFENEIKTKLCNLPGLKSWCSNHVLHTWYHCIHFPDVCNNWTVIHSWSISFSMVICWLNNSEIKTNQALRWDLSLWDGSLGHDNWTLQLYELWNSTLMNFMYSVSSLSDASIDMIYSLLTLHFWSTLFLVVRTMFVFGKFWTETSLVYMCILLKIFQFMYYACLLVVSLFSYLVLKN